MGQYNDGRHKLPEILENNQCVLCYGAMQPMNDPSKQEWDSFEYVCPACNPRVTISMSGGFVTTLNKILSNRKRELQSKRGELMEFIGDTFHLNSDDFNGPVILE